MLTGLLFDPFALKSIVFGDRCLVLLLCGVSFLYFFNYLAGLMLVPWCCIIPISVCKLNHRCVTNPDSK